MLAGEAFFRLLSLAIFDLLQKPCQSVVFTTVPFARNLKDLEKFNGVGVCRTYFPPPFYCRPDRDHDLGDRFYDLGDRISGRPGRKNPFWGTKKGPERALSYFAKQRYNKKSRNANHCFLPPPSPIREKGKYARGERCVAARAEEGGVRWLLPSMNPSKKNW